MSKLPVMLPVADSNACDRGGFCASRNSLRLVQMDAVHGLARQTTCGSALVILARQRGAIAAARLVLQRLRAAGMYLSDRVIDEALARVGE